MGQLILHVGPHKTGSTYLQQRMLDNRGALATLGIDYPDVGMWENNHHDIAELARIEQFERLADTLGPLAESTLETIILSSENFDRLDVRQVAHLLAALPDNRTVRVVSFLRDRTDLLVSSWQEHVKHGGLMSFFEFAGLHLGHPFSSGLLNFGLMLDAYASQVGINAINIVDYDNAMRGGDIFKDFSRACGLPQMAEVGQNFTINNSLPLWEVEVIRALNARACHDGKLDFANVRLVWVTHRKTWALDNGLIEYLEAAISADARVFDMRGSFIENALHQTLMQSYQSRVLNLGSVGQVEPKTNLVPMDFWMMNTRSQQAIDTLYRLVVEHLDEPSAIEMPEE